MTLPSELQRAEQLTSRLHAAVKAADACGAERVSLRVEHARELLDLLADSLRTARHFAGELREYDGTLQPQRQLPPPAAAEAPSTKHQIRNHHTISH